MIVIDKRDKICEVCGGEITLEHMDPQDRVNSHVWRCNDCRTVYNEKKDAHGRRILIIDKDYYYEH